MLGTRNVTVCVLSYSAMRVPGLILAAILGFTSLATAQNITVVQERRQRAAAAFRDGILLFHASSELDLTADGFRQKPLFYYFTGLGNTVGAVLAIDGKSGESWLFLPSKPPFLRAGLQPEVQPGPESAKRLGMEHVVDWSALEGFLAPRAGQALPLYYGDDLSTFAELPANLLSPKSPQAPMWLQIILQKWPAFEAKESGERIGALMAVQSAEETAALRSAAKATVIAVTAGMLAIRPGVSQRSVEAVVENTCWSAGAHGTSFWPWAMAGDNAIFPRPFTSLARYDHLNQNMRSGDLVRLDVGCEQDHYMGDLGGQFRSPATMTKIRERPGRYSWRHIMLVSSGCTTGPLSTRSSTPGVQNCFVIEHPQRLRLRSTRSIPGQIARMFRTGKCIRRT